MKQRANVYVNIQLSHCNMCGIMLALLIYKSLFYCALSEHIYTTFGKKPQ